MKKKSLAIGKFIIHRSLLMGLFIVALVGVISYARGYRLSLSQQKVVPTGILVVSSYPNGASIYVDGELKGATNTNLSLPPGTYKVEIKKDGYSSWEKDVKIKGELVLKVDALLYPQNPSLSPVTNLGVVRAWYFPDTNKSVFLSTESKDQNVQTTPTTPVTLASKQETKGIYLLDSSAGPIRVSSPLKLLVPRSALPPQLRPDQLTAELSPKGDQVLVKQTDSVGVVTTAYLLSTSEKTKTPFNVTQSAYTIQQAWQRQREEKVQKQLEALKEPLTKIASDFFDIVVFSPSKEKILYVAKRDATVPIIINPPLVATNQTPQERSLQKGSVYVYDIKEDTNYRLPKVETAPDVVQDSIKKTYLWYPDSQHIVLSEGNKISVVDYDGTRKHTVYSGPLEEDFLGVTGDYKLLVLANLNPQSNQLPDLYSVGIR